jgi:hypothetical protein
MTQLQLANAAGVSRQTLSRAVASDEISPQTERRIDDALARSATASAFQAPRLTFLAPEPWARATDLVQWSERREAQHELPALIRDLVRLTTPALTTIAFRAGEGVQLGGFDGWVNTSAATLFVPAGESIWEIGTSKRITEKALADLVKRTANPGGVDPARTSFIFVTSRRFPDKEAWAADRKSESVWKSVRVLDADDIEAWLQDAPSIHLRLSRLIGLFPPGAQDLTYWWENWSGATRPNLTPAFVLAGRNEQSSAIQERLKAAASVFRVRSESRDESIAAIAAAILSLPQAEAEELMARSIVVDDASAWRSLVGSRSRLFLMPSFEVGDAVSAALRSGHAVALPLGEGDVEGSNTIALPPVGRAAAIDALVAAGLTLDETEHGDQKADRLARLARRSMTAFRRRIGVSTQLRRPEWARPEVARKAIAALLSASWDDRVIGDRTFLERVALKSYTDMENGLAQISNDTDPLMRRRGSIWYLVSRQDAWDSLGRFITDADIERFRVAAIETLSAVDPRYDMPRDKRWLAGLSDERPATSGLLRGAIAETIALIGSRTDGEGHSEPIQTVVGAPSLGGLAARVVREVLENANRDWRLWASLSGLLPDMAEAAPDAFLGALDDGLRQDPSPVAALFDEEGGGMFGGPSPHTGLLWALERLAWSPDYLGHVTKSLAELMRRDPARRDSKGRLGNRPEATLHSIFRPWMPQTGASLPRRFTVVDSLVRTHEEIVWNILISTLPEFHGVGFYTARPNWREWDGPRPVKQGEYEEAVAGAIQRLLLLSREDGERWSELIKAVANLGERDREMIIGALSALTELRQADRAKISAALRELVANHRSFPAAQWAMPAVIVDQIDSLRSHFDVDDPIERNRWLFSWHARLPKPKTTRLDNFQEHENEIEEERRRAISEITSQRGIAGVLELAATADQPFFVGRSAGMSEALDDEQAAIISEHIASAETYRAEFARGYAAAKVQDKGQKWVEKMVDSASSLQPIQKAALLALLPSSPDLWSFAASLGHDVEREYWKTEYTIPSHEHIEEAARRLISFGRFGRAADLLAMFAHNSPVDPVLVVEALKGILESGAGSDVINPNLGYDLTVLLEQVENAQSVDKAEIARLEWGFLPLLEHSRHPRALHEALAQDPAFFAELIKLVFRGENDSANDGEQTSDADRARWSRAYSLLHSWRTVPGSSENRPVNAKVLMDWVSRARELLASEHRLDIGDQMIGQMLSGAPSDSDGTWPCAAVREVIEHFASGEMERGLSIGTFNSRGVFSRAIGEGGRQERALAEKYEGLAAAVVDSSARTARMLRDMAMDYRHNATREDREAALEDDLGH